VRKLALVAMMAMTLTFTACTSSSAAASGRSGSAIPATDVLNLEMFNARSGVAVVFSPLPPVCKHNCTAGVPARFRDYLAATSDGGQTWRTTGKLPANFHPGATYALQLAFRNPNDGYHKPWVWNPL
jgi:predicted component of type VI protein secretion system